MSIKSIEAIPISMPFEIGAPKPVLAGKPREMEMLLIRVETDRGIVGWGEAFGFAIWPATKAVIETLVAPQCIGRDESNISALHDELARKFHLLGRSGPAMYALSGLNLALWDILGKASGRPVCELLGGRKRDSVEAYASLMRYANAGHVARNAAKAVSEGFRAIKIHEIQAEYMESTRLAIGPDIPLMVDANCPWSTDEALATSAKVRHLDLAWLEEPTWPPEDYQALARVRKESGIAIAAGENAQSFYDFQSMWRAGAVDFIQPSATKIGGLTEMVRIGDWARENRIKVAPHSPYMGPGLLATIHLLASWDEEVSLEFNYCDLEANPVGAAVQVIDGRLMVPTAPGLGADPDLAVIDRYRVR